MTLKKPRSSLPYVLGETNSEENEKYLCYIIHKNNSNVDFLDIYDIMDLQKQ